MCDREKGMAGRCVIYGNTRCHIVGRRPHETSKPVEWEVSFAVRSVYCGDRTWTCMRQRCQRSILDQ